MKVFRLDPAGPASGKFDFAMNFAVNLVILIQHLGVINPKLESPIRSAEEGIGSRLRGGEFSGPTDREVVLTQARRGVGRTVSVPATQIELDAWCYGSLFGRCETTLEVFHIKDTATKRSKSRVTQKRVDFTRIPWMAVGINYAVKRHGRLIRSVRMSPRKTTVVPPDHQFPYHEAVALYSQPMQTVCQIRFGPVEGFGAKCAPGLRLH